MGRQQGKRKVTRPFLRRFVIKVQTNRELLATESTVKVKKNSVQFIFDKYNSSSQLSLTLDGLKGSLDWRGIVKKIKGEFGIFIIKKKVKGKWGALYEPQLEEDVTVSDIGDRVHENILSQEDEPKSSTGSQPADNHLLKPKKPENYGELTNELVEAMYENKRVSYKMSRRQSRAKSLVKNFKSIMSKYGNQSRKQLNKKDSSRHLSKQARDEKTFSNMESFLQAENRVFQRPNHYNGTVSKVGSRFGCRSSDQINKMSKSRSISKSKTGNARLSHLIQEDNFEGSRTARNKTEDEAKTGLFSDKTEKKVKRGSKNSEEFKVLTIEDLMKKRNKASFQQNNGGQHAKGRLKLISEISSEPHLLKRRNPFKKNSQIKRASVDSFSGIGSEQLQQLEMDLRRHKEQFLAKHANNRKSIYHQQMSKNMLENLKKSRKSINSLSRLTSSYRIASQNRTQKKEKRRAHHSPTILEELQIEISKEHALIQNSQVNSKPANTELPVKKNLASKSHRVIKPRLGYKKNKSNPRLQHGMNRRLRNIEKSLKPKSVPKRSGIRSMSKPYQNRRKGKQGSSIVFTKPKNNKRKPVPKVKSRSAVQNRNRNQLKRSKVEVTKHKVEELESIYNQVSDKKQEILDTFAGLSLDMGWIHKQCRHMNLQSSEGVVRFLELQNRLIIKLASKLRKEKNSRYRVEQQCQNMMEKFSKKLEKSLDKSSKLKY